MKKHSTKTGLVLQSFIDKSINGFNINSSMFAKICEQSHALYSKDLVVHYGCVNAVEFSNDGTLFISGGDDRRVLLWVVSDLLNDQPLSPPVTMDAEHSSNIFCLSFSHDNRKVFSGGNDEQVIIHDTQLGKPLDYFPHERSVHSIALSYESNSYFATACDDGKIRIFDTRQPHILGSPSVALAEKDSSFHSVMFHPVDNRIVATANAEDGAELWDVREPRKCLMRYPSKKGAMSARFNYSGTRLLCLRRKNNPIVYDLHQQESNGIELSDVDYFNSCTMKSCTFAGSGDEFAVSGSDDHNIYVWKLPSDNLETRVKTHMVLRGHRSIVNNVRYNPLTCCLASSGVEKTIKIWSSSPFPNSIGGLDEAAAKDMLTRARHTKNFIRRVVQNTEFMTSSDVQRSTEEDPNMLAFFDLLVERDRATWSSIDSTGDSDSDLDDDMNESPFIFDTSSSSDSPEGSFNIEDSSSDTSQELYDTVAGPSGWNPSGSSQTNSGTRRATISIGPHVLHVVDTSTEEEQVSESSSANEVKSTGPVLFRQTNRQRKQYRHRSPSSSSSS